ncbi:MAG: hypothetical protein SFY56_05170 [Bacteroidota bacterium]|nr:hypothetical protein [Bacteroidota bacterium]
MEEIKAHTYKWYEFGCKDATYLITKEKFNGLSISEKGLLKFHLLTCKYCRKFVSQVNAIDKLILKNVDNINLTLSKEKKDALNQLITKKI